MILFYFLILTLPLTNHPLLAQTAAGATVFKLIGGACLLIAVVHLPSRRTIPRFIAPWQTRLFVLLVLIASRSYAADSLRKTFELSQLVSYLSLLILLFITLTMVDSLGHLRHVLMVSIGSLAFASLYVLREWQHDHGTYANLRPGYITGDANEFAVMSLVVLPIGYYLMIEARSRWQRIYCLGCGFLTLVAMLIGASRGGFIGLGAALLFMVWQSKRRIRNLVFVVVPVALALLFLPIPAMQRLANPTWLDTQNTESRLASWEGGKRMIASHPVFGVGLGNYKPLLRQYVPEAPLEIIAHNTYVEIGAELGLPALLVFVALLFSTYRSLANVHREAARAKIRLLEFASLGIRGGLVGYSVSACFVSVEYERLLWLMIFLSACLPELLRNALVQRRKVPGPIGTFVAQPLEVSARRWQEV